MLQPRATVCFLIAVVIAHANPAYAQTVGGRVTERAGGTPLPGVYVYLATKAGAVAVGGLTDTQGLFVLRAPVAGQYDLHAEFIGHEPSVIRSLDLESSAPIRRDLQMSVRAINLAAITADVGSRCRSGPPAAPATVDLWNEARTALRVARWTQETGALQFGLVRTRRELDPITLEVLAEETQSRRGYFTRSPYVALPAEQLSQRGYVTRAADGVLDYWAPDAAVLLSDSFLADHCFRIATPIAAAPDLLGLAFEPVSGRDVPEIEGVLWIDAQTSELRRLDFRYVNLPFAEQTQWDKVGGRVEFTRLENGMWIVGRWHIRMPILEYRMSAAGVPRSRELVLLEINELSSEVIALRGPVTRTAEAEPSTTDSIEQPDTPANEPPRQRAARAAVEYTVQSAREQAITGTVSDDAGAAADVTVLLLDSMGTQLATVVTNQDGAFRFDHPGRDGVYRLIAEHIGYSRTVQSIALNRGEAVAVEIRLAGAAIPLGEIVVTARRQDFLSEAGFYDRMERGLGWFVDAAEIDRRKPSRITDLMRGASGIQVISTGAFDADIRVFDSQRLRGDCPPTIYIDGLLARAYPRPEPPLTQLVDVASVAALEVLRRPAEIPSQYRGSQAACGVVLVWLNR